MNTLLLIFVLIVIYPYTVYYVVLFLISMFCCSHRQIKEVVKIEHQTVSLVISAYNEESVIKNKLENTLKLSYPKDKLRVIVASESNDRTNEIVKEYEDLGIELYARTDRHGKSKMLSDLRPHLDSDIIVFSDANGVFQSDAIENLVRHFSDKSVGCVSGKLVYLKEGSTVEENEAKLLYLDSVIKSLSSDCGFVPGVYGSIFAVRSDTFFPLDEYHCDDFDLSVNSAIHGHKVVFEPLAVSVEKTSLSIGEELKRKERMVRMNFKSLMIYLIKSLENRRFFVFFQLFSHKFIRWVAFPAMVGALIVNAYLAYTEEEYVSLFYAQIVYYFIVILDITVLVKDKWRIKKIMRVLSYFLAVNFYYFLGVIKAILAGNVVSWSKNRI